MNDPDRCPCVDVGPDGTVYRCDRTIGHEGMHHTEGRDWNSFTMADWSNIKTQSIPLALMEITYLEGWNGEGSDRKSVGTAMAMNDGRQGSGFDGEHHEWKSKDDVIAWMKSRGATKIVAHGEFTLP